MSEIAYFYYEPDDYNFELLGHMVYMFYTFSELRQQIKKELIIRGGNTARLEAYGQVYHFRLKNGKLYKVRQP